MEPVLRLAMLLERSRQQQLCLCGEERYLTCTPHALEGNRTRDLLLPW